MAQPVVVKPEPEAIEFRPSRDGSIAAYLRLRNVAGTQIAYKVKSTAPKNYSIKPGSASIRANEFHDVQIVRKTPEEGGVPLDQGRKDKFLVQAAVVKTQEQKLLLYAADKGKAQGRTKFWDSISKEELQETQLLVQYLEASETTAAPEAQEDELSTEANVAEKWKARKLRSQEHVGAPAAMSDDADQVSPEGPASGPGAGRGTSKEGSAPRRGYMSAGGAGMPNTEDVDALIGRMTKLGADGKPVAQVKAAAPPPPGFSSAPVADDGAMTSAAPPAAEGATAAPEAASAEPAAERKPLQLTSASKLKKCEDVVMNGHSRPVTFITWEPSSRVLYTCAKDKLVFAWSPDGECLRKFEGHRGAVWSCSLNHDEDLLLTCGADNFIMLWKASTAEKMFEMELPGVARCVEWSFGLCLRFACCSNGFKAKPASVCVYELSSLAGSYQHRCCSSIEEPTLPSAASQVAWAGPYREWLCSAHDDGIVVFWNALTGRELSRLQAHEGSLSRVAFPQHDGRLMATCCRSDMQVRLWCLAAPEEKEGEDSGSDFENDLTGTAPNPMLMRSFTCDRPLNAVALRPTFAFRDAAQEGASGGPCVLLTGGGQDARDVALVGAGTDVDQFEPLALRLAPVDGEDAPGLELCPAEGNWDSKSRKGGHFGPINVLSFSPNCRLCASGGEDGNVRLRELPMPAVGV
eukprot:TRINITY_DN61319_c0_g1_i1.p1 TRINITY_DN61319_c0_g1~~TRINITY_DN61319_c0_g1_i1.p1  ORF type:complete len:700 (-),score=105.42 TRINITY_DN61319_c0_g1_i1:65-2137(-)